MVELLARLRIAAWPLVIGMIAGGAVVLFAGPGLFWGLVALGLAVLLIVQFVSFQEPILRPPEQQADDPLAALPPMTRVLLDQLPMPVMLLDDDERVLFVNRSMRDVLGPGAGPQARLSRCCAIPRCWPRSPQARRRLSHQRALHPAGADRAALPGLCRARSASRRR